MGKEIKDQGDKDDVYDYMMSLTEPFSKQTPSAGYRMKQNVFALLVFVIFTCMMVTN